MIVLAGLVGYRLLLSPASVTFEYRPSVILTNSSSENVVHVFPVNRLGLKIPFVHLAGRFVVSQGKEKIDILREKNDELIFKTRNVPGRLVILYYTSTVPFPVEIILDIENASIARVHNLSILATGCANA